MNLNIQEIICIVVMVISVISCILVSMNHSSLKEVIKAILSACSTIIAFFLMLRYYDKFNDWIGEMLTKVFSTSIRDNGIVHVFVLVVIFFVLKIIINIILNLIQTLFLKDTINRSYSNRIFFGIISFILGIIRGLIVIVLICIALILYNTIVSSEKKVVVFHGLNAYHKLEKIIDVKRVERISDGIKQNISPNKTVYYNGITLDEGVKSNDEINKKAESIVKKESTDRGKAEKIYKWVGSSIRYDEAKADMVINEEKGYESGAIPTFSSKKGICFDYTCLYTAMAKSVGLKTRIIVGRAFNGEEYVSHAWNEVYLADEEKWINVDSTFYASGNYFDNNNFYKDHIMESVAGEF